MSDRFRPWLSWVADVRSTHIGMEFGNADETTRKFFVLAYAAQQPSVVNVPFWSANDWTADIMKFRVGAETMVEVQAGRDGDPDYERNRRMVRMTFGAFMDELSACPGNDVYMTANNGSVNIEALRGLGVDMKPLPKFLTDDPSQRFLWIGGRSETPLHHDLTNNFLVQIVGRKRVRLFSPAEVVRLKRSTHVYSDIRIPTDDICAECGLSPVDVVIEPGRALFIPVGWWHSVTSLSDLSVTATFVGFPWRNSGWEVNFPH